MFRGKTLNQLLEKNTDEPYYLILPNGETFKNLNEPIIRLGSEVLEAVEEPGTLFEDNLLDGIPARSRNGVIEVKHPKHDGWKPFMKLVPEDERPDTPTGSELTLDEILDQYVEERFAACLPIGSKNISSLQGTGREIFPAQSDCDDEEEYEKKYGRVMEAPARVTSEGFLEIFGLGNWISVAKIVGDDDEVTLNFAMNILRYPEATWHLVCYECSDPDCPGELDINMTSSEVVDHFAGMSPFSKTMPMAHKPGVWDGDILKGKKSNGELVQFLRLVDKGQVETDLKELEIQQARVALEVLEMQKLLGLSRF